MERDPLCFQLHCSLKFYAISLYVSTYHVKRINDLLRKHIIEQHRSWPVFDFFFQPRLSIEYQGRVLEPHREILHVSWTMFTQPRTHESIHTSRLVSLHATNRCMENHVKELQQGISTAFLIEHRIHITFIPVSSLQFPLMIK